MARASSAVLPSRTFAARGVFGRGLPPSSVLPERLVVLLRESRWLLQCCVAIFFALILLSYNSADPGWSHAVSAREIRNLGGRFGAYLADLLLYLFGLSAWLWAGFLLLRVVTGYRQLHPAHPVALSDRDQVLDAAPFGWDRWIGFAMCFAGSVAIEASRMAWVNADLPLTPGGVVGRALADLLLEHLGAAGGTLLMLLSVVVGFSLMVGQSWLTIFERTGARVEAIALGLLRAWEALRDRREGERAATVRTETVEVKRRILADDPEPVRIEPQAMPPEPSVQAQRERQQPLFKDLPASTGLPALALLDEPAPTRDTVAPETLEFTSRLIEKKLADFGVAVNVVAAYPGPVITRYEIEPATGVKGSVIVNLSKDLARALSLTSIRVVETIPGKSLMGLELPNARRQSVRLTEILGSQVYADAASAVTLALGHDIAGRPVVADLAKMPHLLVAGTTGSGKSVGINAMLLSLLYKAEPADVRLILIDPKMLEMSTYEGIPHLLAPVVTDMRQAGHALNWCVAEMERRYKLMSKLGVRNLSGYNSRIADAARRDEVIGNPFSLTPEAPEPLGKLPVIVVVIDELADLMMVVGKKIEELIARLAQKARAAGIHLILATQRPSVDVITGLIKANIPTRIAFQVSSRIDSRTILDQMGAEALLGQGDMLYMPPGTGLPMRVHGAYVGDDEVARVVAHWREQADPDYIEGILEGAPGESVDTGSAVGFGGLQATLQEAGVDGESDALYDQAVAVVLQHKRASISLVQRHLRIGYNRAARLLEQMEKSGIVSAMATNGNRDIIVPRRDDPADS